MVKQQADVVIIGAGIVGTAIARELSRYSVSVIVCDQGADVASGTTKANSGILHSGIDAAPGTLKAKLNVRGFALYQKMHAELGLDIKFTGSLIAATCREEIAALEELAMRGRRNGVAGDIRILSRAELAAKEPGLSPAIPAALWVEAAGIVCPYGAAMAFARNAIRNGAAFLPDCKVQKVVSEAGRVVGLETTRGFIKCRYVVNAAGLWADDVSRSCGDDSFVIRPRKGEYILFDKSVGNLVNTVVFPTPGRVTKGILVAPTTHGNYFVGPNAQDTLDKGDLATTREGLEEIVSGARKLIPSLPLAGAITQFAGLRAVADGGDFIIRPSDKVFGLFHAAGIQSPGLTAAPAIAEMMVELLAEAGLPLTPKQCFDPVEPRPKRFRELSYQERDELIRANPLYGRIICRCEQVTEGEIVDAIREQCGARTLDGVKRRTRAGMGRCQGGFCSPRVAAILARELNMPLAAICKDGAGSALFIGKYSGNEVHEHV
ncbi:MAG: NAD(P)/FAD-dependent oxidoreductase [Negativicutes bacterium]|nr:NAD(P)/FAD-dependent oxidoreductase [Negativicutes bacterium]